MHKITKNELDNLARWTQNVARADPFATALQAALPIRQDTGTYSNITSNFGMLTLDVYQAESINVVQPYLVAARVAGFERVGEIEERPNDNRVTWRYEAKEGECTITLSVVLHFWTGESATCRYVEIGKKTIPDVKLLCGDELAEWDAGHEE